MCSFAGLAHRVKFARRIASLDRLAHATGGESRLLGEKLLFHIVFRFRLRSPLPRYFEANNEMSL
jgi:hypothetical protein